LKFVKKLMLKFEGNCGSTIVHCIQTMIDELMYVWHNCSS